jgi:transposase
MSTKEAMRRVARASHAGQAGHASRAGRAGRAEGAGGALRAPGELGYQTVMDAFPDEPCLASEEAALAHLLEHCWPGGRSFCPRCGGGRLYELSAGRWRCAGCKYTFHPFSGRWINNGNLTPLTWLRLLHLYAGEATVHTLAAELGLSYNAAYKAVTTARFAILAHAPDARQLLGPETGLGSYLKGKKLTGEPKGGGGQVPIPVFGILERNGWVFIDLVSGLSAETVFHFNHNFHLRIERAGNLVHTAPYRHYDALVLCGDDSLPYEYIRRRADGPAEPQSEFWKFAGGRLRAFKGVSPQRFPLYLKELEFRFNHRRENLFATLVRYLCDMVPDVPELDESRS